MKTLLRLLLVCGLTFLAGRSYAVLPNGSPAKDFTVTDLNGVTWNLFDLLDQGYTVYLEFSATWCGPCWNYHNSGALKDLYNQYGPNGTDEVFVIFLEGDLNTNTNCLYGTQGCNNSTYGDWVTGTPFPITDLNSSNQGIKSDYNITYYPTIYSICPTTRTVYEAGQRNTAGQYEYVTSCGLDWDLVNVTDASCFGLNDGGIDIDPVNGLQPYTFSWSNGQSTQDLSNVPAGTYTCEIREKNGVKVTTTQITVGEPDEINVMADGITWETCPGDEDGGIQISAGGGAGGFGYSWSNGSTDEDLADLGAGTYTVEVTDATGCVKSQSFTVPVNPVPVADGGNDGVVTCKDQQYTIDGTKSEPNGVTYEWTTTNGNIVSGANTPTPVVDAEGDYQLTVTFLSTGCSSQDEVQVFEDKDAPLTSAGPDLMLSCAVTKDTLDGGASQQGNGIAFLWTTNDGHIVSGASTPYPVVDEEGSYFLAVSNEQNGCVGRDTAIVSLDTMVTNPSGDYTFQTNNFIVNFNASATGNPTSFSWTFGDGTSSNLEDPVKVYASAGQYEVCLIVSNACGSDTTCNMVSVTSGALSVAIASITPSTCNNGSNGGVDIVVAGGDAPYSFLWSSGQTTEDLADVAPGSYTLTVTDAQGATQVISANIGYTNLVNIDQVLSSEPTCFGTSNGTIALNTSSSSGQLAFTWSHDPNLNNSVANNLPAGSYTVITTDPNGCTDSETIQLSEPAALLGNLLVVNSGQGLNNGSASVSPNGGTSPYNVAWSNGATGLSVSNLAPGEYTVTITDANGCAWTQIFTVNAETSSVSDISSLTFWSVAPNPASESFVLDLKFDRFESLQIRLLSVVGHEVYSQKAEGALVSQNVPVGSLAAGVYMLEVRTSEGRMVQRIVVE